MHDYQACGGPARCRFCRHILNTETHDEAVARWHQENRELGLRTTSVQTLQEERMERASQNIPNPYARDLAALRAKYGDAEPAAGLTADDPRLTAMQEHRAAFYDYMITARAAVSHPATSRTHLVPPDPYQIAIDKLPEDRR